MINYEEGKAVRSCYLLVVFSTFVMHTCTERIHHILKDSMLDYESYLICAILSALMVLSGEFDSCCL